MGSIISYAAQEFRNEIIKVEVLSITIPAKLDDHGLLGMATPDFEFKLQVDCSNDDPMFIDISSEIFQVKANNSESEVEHNLEGENISIILDNNELEKCKRLNYFRVILAEDEFIDNDFIILHNLKSEIFGRETRLKDNGTLDLEVSDGPGESLWSIFGFGPNKKIKMKVRFSSSVNYI